MKPIAFRFNDERYRDDPWSVYTEFRELGTIIPIKLPFIGRTWAATTYESVNRVFKDDEAFARDPVTAGRKTFGYIQHLLPRVFNSLTNNMLGKDGIDHRRMRAVVDQAFARRNIDGMSDRIGQLAAEQMSVVQAIIQRDGRVDLNEHFSRPFPLTVICELLGMPLEDRDQFKDWFKPMSNSISFLTFFKLGRNLKKMTAYLKDQFESVRKEPREGLITELVREEYDGQKLTETELLAMVFLLFVAGHETTVHLINNCVLTFMQHPESKRQLAEDWKKVDSAIEEVLRYCSPLQLGKPRFVTQDMDFFGQGLKRGEMITPLIASANCDPAKFECPRDFQIDRQPNHHMSFGSGPHTCLGMKLARSEVLHGLQELYARFPDLKPAFDILHPDWSNRPGTRGVKTLMVSD